MFVVPVHQDERLVDISIQRVGAEAGVRTLKDVLVLGEAHAELLRWIDLARRLLRRSPRLGIGSMQTGRCLRASPIRPAPR